MLSQIVADKRRHVAARPFAGEEGLVPSDRSLFDALRRPETGFILECKRRSPSRGELREAYDPAAIARSYAPFASGISVLCDEPYFGGSLEHLAAVRAAVDVPVLCKDFVVDSRQILEARRHGADAILLMVSVLTQDELVQCLEVTRKWNMDALVEVHDEAELARALAADAVIIGINNRNLKTLEVDRATAARLAPAIPRGERVVVAESGMRNHGDIRALRGAVDAFLVGSSMMSRRDLDAAVRELVFGRVKICGLTRPEDARAAWDAGATHGGLVLWEGSPRGVSVDDAMPLAEVPLQWVGVFVNEAEERVVHAVERLGLSVVQLHGDETPAQVAALRTRLPEHVEVWKARRAEEMGDEAAASWNADRWLLDAGNRQERGGTGRAFDWSLVQRHAERASLVLAGGIRPDNAPAAEAVGAWALDLSSGVEVAPGRKDETKLQALFSALRGGRP